MDHTVTDSFTFEVCIDNLQSAKAAIDGGADRLEVCSALPLGGLTPTKGLLLDIRDYLRTKKDSNVHLATMIRSRSGDFLYSPDEIKLMKKEIEVLQDVSDSFVFGCLTVADGIITCNNDQCAALLQACDGKPATFHRAIDACTNMLLTCGNLVTLGFKRILTSGGSSSAIIGVMKLEELQSNYGNQITIVAGSGVADWNVGQLYEKAKVLNFHSSCSDEIISPISKDLDGIFKLGVSKWNVASINKVIGMKKAIDELKKNHNEIN